MNGDVTVTEICCDFSADCTYINKIFVILKTQSKSTTEYEYQWLLAEVEIKQH
jgi:hypothetical protein